ncbi:sugar phosphate isomerase/epimerase [Ereboglobus sp. PH5-5]|uniref:sugar phosphate isomerase/epimerase family protein n=1 Tax=Ereboglobus sp. PH5-5 TaxID=2940529 RepID=UPI00240750B4|nr:TIM barrel protein [Ereboglobus sp. PH5-5]MDF9833413.1 sugar phosphate isomerase/epimerase [Ereboglobus sp. PH5-5]
MRPAESSFPPLALSTCWCSHRHTDGYAMLREIADMGFSHAELSHGVQVTLVPGILRALEKGVIKISSTHNFCPLPTGFSRPAPNAYEPSVDDPTHHDQWVRQTRRSLDFAAQVGARVLVTHLGSVRFWWRNPVKKLLARADEYYSASDAPARFAGEADFAALREKVLRKVRERMPPNWNQVRASIGEIREYAVERGVTLGFENRERPDELPLDDQFGELLDGLARPNTAAYWHDTGHARLKEQLGILSHREHLEKNAGRLAGFHLHDTTADGRDHQPIGAGEIDFEMVSRFWKPHHKLVLELSPRVSVENVIKSKNKIEALMRG